MLLETESNWWLPIFHIFLLWPFILSPFFTLTLSHSVTQSQSSSSSSVSFVWISPDQIIPFCSILGCGWADFYPSLSDTQCIYDPMLPRLSLCPLLTPRVIKLQLNSPGKPTQHLLSINISFFIGQLPFYIHYHNSTESKFLIKSHEDLPWNS